jgi:hypothetical protein
MALFEVQITSVEPPVLHIGGSESLELTATLQPLPAGNDDDDLIAAAKRPNETILTAIYAAAAGPWALWALAQGTQLPVVSAPLSAGKVRPADHGLSIQMSFR